MNNNELVFKPSVIASIANPEVMEKVEEINNKYIKVRGEIERLDNRGARVAGKAVLASLVVFGNIIIKLADRAETKRKNNYSN